MKFRTTADLKVPKLISEQIIGQDEGVNIIKKAARQRRHVLLIGTPGTGKSMLGQALAELLPKSKLVDVLALTNKKDENQPLIRTLPAGKGTSLVQMAKIKSMSGMKNQQLFFMVLAFIALLIPWYMREEIGDIMAAASLLAGMLFVGIVALSFAMTLKKKAVIEPKLIVDNSKAKRAPFIDATGSHSGSLLGDCLHDPFQSGGLGTPAHLRVESGMIHKANQGVLFIDEVATLQPKMQQELLTALQEKKYPITGQSERSAGAMVRTEPVPCDFILVAAGNVETVQRMHPALRSRIRGYGYEVYMNDEIADTPKNRELMAYFVAQEIQKDKKIPHFTYEAVQEIIKDSKKRAGRKGKLTLKLRDLGGLVRAAGDLASEQGAKFVDSNHVTAAKKLARTLEQQIVDKYIERRKEYEVLRTTGFEIGRVNGLAVLGEDASGIVLPIEAEVTGGGRKAEQFVAATGKLGEIAKEAITNVSAVIKKLYGEDIGETKDIYVQFLQTVDSGVEGDSASIAVATAIISALKKKPIRQDTALTGSLSVRGEVLPVGGVTQKIEAAIEAGIKRVIVPAANLQDVVLSKDSEKKIKIIPVKNMRDVLKHALK